MRITGGKLRGRVVGGKVRTGVRPTSSRVREALFSIIGQDLEGRTVLDAFGGSGMLTFEACSRGATVTTVERNRAAAMGIQRAAAQLDCRLDLRVDDVRNVATTGSWTIVIMDPPYAEDPVDWLEVGSTAAEELLVIEHRSGVSMPIRIANFEQERSRRYGDSTLPIFRRL